jgi:hypothetical protein
VFAMDAPDAKPPAIRAAVKTCNKHLRVIGPWISAPFAENAWLERQAFHRIPESSGPALTLEALHSKRKHTKQAH